jgi:hypothetical protein
MLLQLLSLFEESATGVEKALCKLVDVLEQVCASVLMTLVWLWDLPAQQRMTAQQAGRRVGAGMLTCCCAA